MLQIILLYVLRQIVYLNRREHRGEREHRGAVAHCGLAVERALRVQQDYCYLEIYSYK